MMEWIKKHDVVTKVFSLLVAIVLWMYVIESTDAPGTKRFTNVDIQFQGIETLQENGLTILEGADATVSVEVTGERKKLNQVERDNLMAKKATFRKDGEKTRTCEVCEYVEKATIQATGSPAKTGDDSHIGMWAGILCVSLAGIIALVVLYKKKHKK